MNKAVNINETTQHVGYIAQVWRWLTVCMRKKEEKQLHQ